MSSLGHPRGCSCEVHLKQRNYARELRARKVSGEHVSKERGPNGKSSGIKSGPLSRRPDSRMVEDKTGENTVIHWMPAEGGSWTCPQCGAGFMKIDGEWMLTLAPGALRYG